VRQLFSLETNRALFATVPRRLLITAASIGWLALIALAFEMLPVWAWAVGSAAFYIGELLLGSYWADKDRADRGATPPDGRTGEEAD